MSDPMGLPVGTDSAPANEAEARVKAAAMAVFLIRFESFIVIYIDY